MRTTLSSVASFSRPSTMPDSASFMACRPSSWPKGVATTALAPRPQQRVARQGEQEGQHGPAACVPPPQTLEHPEEEQPRVEPVELAQPLERELTGRRRPLPEAVALRDGLCVVRRDASPGTASRSCDSSSSMIVRLVWVPRSPERNPQRVASFGERPAIPGSKFRSDTGLMIGDGRREAWSVHFRRLVCRRGCKSRSEFDQSMVRTNREPGDGDENPHGPPGSPGDYNRRVDREEGADEPIDTRTSHSQAFPERFALRHGAAARGRSRGGTGEAHALGPCRRSCIFSPGARSCPTSSTRPAGWARRACTSCTGTVAGPCAKP